MRNPGSRAGTNIRRIAGSLVLVVLVGLAGVGVARALPAPPVECTARLLDDSTVEITWRGGSDLLDIIRNGQTIATVFLREDGARHIDNEPTGGVTTYEIAGRDRFGDPRAETEPCGTVQTVASPPLVPVPSCTVRLDDYGHVFVQWPETITARSYVVRVNGVRISSVIDIGGVDVVTTTTNTYYAEPAPYPGFQTEHCSVSTENETGLAPKTYCGKVVPDDLIAPPPAPPTRPTSCSVELVDSDPHLRWGHTPNDAVSIWRNGHIISTRDERDGDAFFDFAPPTGTVHYSVSGRVGDQLSAKRYCGLVEITVDAQASCQVVRNSGVFDVRWTGFETDEVVIRRSVDGSPWYWRGRTTGASFDDSWRSGDIRYQVAPRTAGGQTGPATICTMS